MLKPYFDSAWKELKLIYDEGNICSERHMQCELFRLLINNEDFNKHFQIFVEPRLSALKIVIPDFLIASRKTSTVIAAVEIKYVPNSYSKYQKDLNTLIGFYRLFNEKPDYSFPLLTNPSNGEWINKPFKFDKDLTLIYCIITKVDAYVISHHKELWKCDDNSNFGKISYLQYVGAIPANDDESWKCM